MPLFQKRHYEAIASRFHDARMHVLCLADDASERTRMAFSEGIDAVATELANHFERDSPAFDKERFLRACRPKSKRK